MKPALLFTLFIFFCTLSHSQVDEWVIKRAEVYNKKTKQRKIDTSGTGRIYISPSSNRVTIWTKSSSFDIRFNNCEGNIFNSEHYAGYTLKNYALPKDDKQLYISYTYTEDDNENAYATFTNSEYKNTYTLIRIDNSVPKSDFFEAFKYLFDNMSFDWIYIGDNIEGDLTFIKSEETKGTNYNHTQVWVKHLLKTFKYKGVSYSNVEMKILMYFDCNGNKIKSGQAIYYTSKGGIIASEDEYYPIWDDVIPETLGETMLKKVCELFKK